jgi:hypothetical protein
MCVCVTETAYCHTSISLSLALNSSVSAFAHVVYSGDSGHSINRTRSTTPPAASRHCLRPLARALGDISGVLLVLRRAHRGTAGVGAAAATYIVVSGHMRSPCIVSYEDTYSSMATQSMTSVCGLKGPAARYFSTRNRLLGALSY